MVVVLPEAEEQKNQINDEAAIFVDIIDRILFQFLFFLFFHGALLRAAHFSLLTDSLICVSA